MSYIDHFTLADDYIEHLDAVIEGLGDSFIESRYIGFTAVSAVTVYELAIKTIFQDFAQKKHPVLANFTNAFFERLNGRIKICVIKDDYLAKFGAKYVQRFERKIEESENHILQNLKTSMRSCYSNLITWRNSQPSHSG